MQLCVYEKVNKKTEIKFICTPLDTLQTVRFKV